MKIRYHGNAFTATPRREDQGAPGDNLGGRPFENHVAVPSAQARIMAVRATLALAIPAAVAVGAASQYYHWPMVLVISTFCLGAWGLMATIDAVLSWVFLLQHRGLIVPREERFPEPQETQRSKDKRIRMGRFQEGDAAQFDADLWEFSRGVFPRGPIDAQSPPWASRAWVGKRLGSGTKVNKAYYARLMEQLTESRAILDRKPGKPGRWNPAVSDVDELVKMLGFHYETQED